MYTITIECGANFNVPHFDSIYIYIYIIWPNIHKLINLSLSLRPIGLRQKQLLNVFL